MPNLPVIVDFPCAICGVRVGYIELYPPNVRRVEGRGSEHPRRKMGSFWEYVDTGDRFGDSELTLGQFERKVADLAGEHPASFLALYCHECGRAYCYDHWTTELSNEPPVTFGTCPQGHGHVIDMG